jgi:hypothetical protein
MADLGTLDLGTYTSSDTQITTVGTPPLLEVIGSADDSDYIYDNSNTSHTAIATFELGSTPADLGTMDTLYVRLRYNRSAYTANRIWDSLRCRIYRADGTTPLTDDVTVASSITTTTATNSSVIQFTGLDTSADRSVWEGALVTIGFTVTKNKGGGSDELQVTAGELTGTYTVSSAQDATITGISAAAATATANAPTSVTAVTAITATAASATASTLLASDTFTRGDSTTLGSTELGSYAWSEISGNIEISSNALEAVYQTFTSNIAVFDSGIADGTFLYNVTTATSSTSTVIQPLFRVVDALNWWAVSIRDAAGGNDIRLVRNVAGTETAVDTWSTTVGPSESYEVVVVASGDDINVYIDGTLRLSTSDSTHNTATEVGVRYWCDNNYEDGTSRLEDIAVSGVTAATSSGTNADISALSVFSDDFTGSNGDPLNASYWDDSNDTGTWDIQSNEARAQAVAAFNWAQTHAAAGLVSADCHIEGDFHYKTTPGYQGQFTVGFRMQAITNNNNRWYLQFVSPDADPRIDLHRNITGTDVIVGTVGITGGALQANEVCHFDVIAFGDLIRVAVTVGTRNSGNPYTVWVRDSFGDTWGNLRISVNSGTSNLPGYFDNIVVTEPFVAIASATAVAPTSVTAGTGASITAEAAAASALTQKPSETWTGSSGDEPDRDRWDVSGPEHFQQTGDGFLQFTKGTVGSNSNEDRGMVLSTMSYADERVTIRLKGGFDAANANPQFFIAVDPRETVRYYSNGSLFSHIYILLDSTITIYNRRNLESTTVIDSGTNPLGTIAENDDWTFEVLFTATGLEFRIWETSGSRPSSATLSGAYTGQRVGKVGFSAGLSTSTNASIVYVGEITGVELPHVGGENKVIDAFSRTVSVGNGWGTADSGQTWTHDTTANTGVDGASGYLTLPTAGETRRVNIPYPEGRIRDDAEHGDWVTAYGSFSVDAISSMGSGTYTDLRVRVDDVGTEQYYYLSANITAAGGLYLQIFDRAGGSNNVMAAPGTVLTGLVADDVIHAQISVRNRTIPTIRVRVWKDGDQPPDWQGQTNDGNAQGWEITDGGVGVNFFVSGSATNVPVTESWHELSVTSPTYIENDFDSGSDGAAITTANSGSATSESFDNVTTGNGGTATYTTDSLSGLAALFDSTATGGYTRAWWETTRLQNSAPAVDEIWFRAYFKLDDVTPADNSTIMYVRESDGSTVGCDITLATTGVLRLRANYSTKYESSTLSADTWYRLELHVLSHPTAGHFEMQLYTGANLHGTTPDETVGVWSADYDTGDGDINDILWGINDSPGQALQLTTDYMAFGDIEWIGPATISTIDSTGTGAATDSRDTGTGSATSTAPSSSATGAATDVRDTGTGSATFSAIRTATGAATDVRDTATASATATQPTASATGAATDSRDTGTGAATFSAIRTATGAATDQRDTVTASATWNGDSAATGAATDSRDAGAGSATSTVPQFTATGAATDSRDTVEAAATATVPQHTATGAATDVRDTAAASATATVPQHTATGAATDSRDTAAASATATAPASTATGAATDQRDTATASATAATSQHTATGAATDIRDTATASATSTVPQHTATGAATDVRDTATASATFTAPASTATAAPTDQRDTSAGAATALSPGVSSSGAATDVRDTATGSGSRTLPPFTASGAATDARDTLAASGTSTVPQFTASVAVSDVRDTAAASATSTAPGATASAAVTDTRDTAAASATATAPASSATLAASDVRDTAAASGTALAPGVSAAAAATDSRDTVESFATSTAPTSAATGAATDARDTGTGSATFQAFPSTATGAATDSRDTAAGFAAWGNDTTGQTNTSDQRDTAAASATVVPPPNSGSGAATDQRDTGTGAATAAVPGATASGAATDQRDTGTGAASYNGDRTAAGAVSDERDTAAGSGTSVAPTGSSFLAETDQRDTCVGAGVCTVPYIAATGDITDQSDTMVAAGVTTIPYIEATGAATDQSDTMVAYAVRGLVGAGLAGVSTVDLLSPATPEVCLIEGGSATVAATEPANPEVTRVVL